MAPRSNFSVPLSLFWAILICSCWSDGASPEKNDQDALLSFRKTADPGGALNSAWNSTFSHCTWRGVGQCNADGRVTKLVLENLRLNGSIGDQTIARLDQLRVLSLKHNRLSGPVPDLSALRDLKILYLNGNFLSGPFPTWLPRLHRLHVIVLADNRFSGGVPASLSNLRSLLVVRLENNHFTGTLPPLKSTAMRCFNVSNNDFSGCVPEELQAFNFSSFLGNRGLCGIIGGRLCNAPVPAVGQTRSGRRVCVVAIAAGAGAAVVVGVLLLVLCYRKKQKPAAPENGDPPEAPPPASPEEYRSNGNVVFCGEAGGYGLEDLLRATAEIIGRGTLGSTYKAVMEGGVTVAVKRLNQSTSAQMSRGSFEKRMEELGRLRHPNVVPVKAYFQTKDERLVVTEFFRNGSLSALVHGGKGSTAGKALHWTSCVKIAEEVAVGVEYVHGRGLVHGALKSTNVLIGADFEALVSDGAVSDGYLDPDAELEASPSSSSSPEDAAAYVAPECAAGRRATAPGDVFAYGVLLLEILTARRPSQVRGAAAAAPAPAALTMWARAARASDDDGGGDSSSSAAALTESPTALAVAEDDDERGAVEALIAVAVRCMAVAADERPQMTDVARALCDSRELAAVQSSSSAGSVSPARWSAAVQSQSMVRDHVADRGGLTERD